VLDAARMAAADINRLIDRFALPSPGLLRDDAEAIAVYIKDGFGHQVGHERDHAWRRARNCAERASERLRAHFAAQRLPAASYWATHHRLMAISKMLIAMLSNR
jgi:hypothetical protein